MKISYFIKSCILSGLVLTLSSCNNSETKKNAEENLTQFVDPYIGTGEHGHVFLGANVPFGLVQVGPTNISTGWDWTSGYHISDSTICGFAMMHLSGTGIGDLGDIRVMPVTGDVTLKVGKPGDYSSGMYSLFNRKSEVAKPGYYAVKLDRYNIEAQLTATSRVGFQKYTYPATDDAKIIIDLNEGFNWDTPAEGYMIQENDSVISGYRFSKGWAADQRIFFTAVFSKPIEKLKLFDGNKYVEGKEFKSKSVVGEILFGKLSQGQEIEVKVALSPTSIENAKLNLQTELPGWDFEETRQKANELWNEQLNKIQITTNDASVKTIFYTSLYHTMIAPSEFSDVNGDYFGADHNYHKGEGFQNYTTFSLWDTYRAAMPLMSIIHPEKMNDVINTFLTIYKQQGRLPVWHLMGNETDCMVGNPSVQIVADAILKGYDGFDKKLAYEAMKNTMMDSIRGLDLYKKYGYIPYDSFAEQTGEQEGLSYALEYAIGDWSLAQVAKANGNTEDYDYFMKRSKTYRYYFDKETGFLRGRALDGSFRPNFDPFHSTHRANDYTEGNAWQYTWLVPHDIKGLAELFGGKDKMINKLDSLFIVEGDLGEDASPDISGLIGQYAHGNEPSHQVLYMYPYLGQPWKTAPLVREVLYTLYDDTPEGIAGNEDVGQISAWYILSAMGMYQVEPAGGKYVLGSPIVDKAVIHVANGKTFTITTKNNSKENLYVQSTLLNGKAYNKYYITFQDIVAGGSLEFVMGDKPSSTWGLED